MNHLKQGSVLLEMIIALGLTTFIVVSTTQLTKTALRTLKEITTLSNYSNKVILTINQIEKDLSSLVVVPTPSQEPNADEKEKNPESKQGKRVSRALIAQADEKKAFKINKKDCLTFKLLNGVTTSTLQAYGENKPHFVRFCYKLIKQTPPPPHQKKPAFKLFRKETSTIDDLNIKQDMDSKNEDLEKSTDWILICNNIHNLTIEYSTLTHTTTNQTEQKNTSAEPKELATSFEWPNKKLAPETQEQTPRFITVTLQMWDEGFSKPTTYQRLITCQNHSGTLPEHTLKTKPNKPKEPDKPAEQAKAAEPTPAPKPKTTPPESKKIHIPPVSRDAPPPPPRPLTKQKTPIHQIPVPIPDDDDIPDDMKALLNRLEHTELAHIDPDKILGQLPPEIADAVKKQMEEFEKHPEKLYQSVMELFK